MVGIKRLKIYLGLFIPFCVFFLMSHNTFAVSVSTSSFDLDYIPSPNASYRWANGLLYGVPTNLQYARRYQFTTDNLTPLGNYASLHFETNIVANASNQSFINFVNRDYMSVLACSSSVSGSLQIQANSVSTAVTTWTDSQNRPSKTLTVYGDVAIGGLSVNQQQQIVCAVGSTSYAFFATNSTSASANMYFEQNPMTILYTNNQSENLLQSQIYQNEQIIGQNNTIINNQIENTDAIINNQTENTEAVINNQNQNTQDIIRSNQDCHQSKNLIDGSYDKISQMVRSTASASGNGFTITSTSSSGATYVTVPIPNITSLLGQTVTLSYSSSGSGIRIGFFYLNSSGGATSNISYSHTTTLPSSLGSNSGIGVVFYTSNNVSATYNDIMLVSGSSPSGYENYGEEICKNYNAEYYDEQRQADQNISNQSSSDIDGAENQATTNLIGVLGGFISAFSNVSATNCNLTLDFPNYAGGSRVVNICSGKEKAPRIVEIGSSLLLIGVFVPLAYILIKMIYNEIRSWTNG